MRLILALLALASISFAQDIGGYIPGMPFKLACERFFSDPNITPAPASMEYRNCASDPPFDLDRMLAGQTTFLGRSYLLILEEYEHKLKDVYLSAPGDRQYSRTELDSVAHLELYEIIAHLTAQFGGPREIYPINSQSLAPGGEMTVAVWHWGDIETRLRLDTPDYDLPPEQQNFIVALISHSRSIVAAIERRGAEIRARFRSYFTYIELETSCLRGVSLTVRDESGTWQDDGMLSGWRQALPSGYSHILAINNCAYGYVTLRVSRGEQLLDEKTSRGAYVSVSLSINLR